MTCSVNLVPVSCHTARQRALRRSVWTVVATTAGMLLVCAWVAGRATGTALLRLDRELAGVQMRQSELDRQLALATTTRNDLARRARALLALRQEQAAPEQLLTLSSRAPDGVVLTEIRAEPPMEAGRPTPRRTAAAAPATEPSAVAPREEARSLVVHVCGYAVEHSELTRLIDNMQSAEGLRYWKHVKLLRVAREPYGCDDALAFHLECRQEEGIP
jgi:hypothetical protein